jgi:HTH-type transcriptional regulator/antitoxin HigA
METDQKLNLAKAPEAWVTLSTTVFVPHTEEEYEQLVKLLDDLIDLMGEDESHPLASRMDVVGVLIEDYEAKHVPEP